MTFPYSVLWFVSFLLPSLRVCGAPALYSGVLPYPVILCVRCCILPHCVGCAVLCGAVVACFVLVLHGVGLLWE